MATPTLEAQTAFQINPGDNVVTALSPLRPGAVRILGEGGGTDVAALDAVDAGHKIALRDIREGEDIVKYGVPIGIATQAIPRGGWVHLHCMGSKYDEKSNSLDPLTGTSINTVY